MTRSRLASAHTSAGSKWVVVGAMTNGLPPHRLMNAAHCAAPCISGATVIDPGPSGRDRSTISSRLVTISLVPKVRPPIVFMKMSCWRHNTALGIPVVPPV